jgi:hypothetical protein
MTQIVSTAGFSEVTGGEYVAILTIVGIVLLIASVVAITLFVALGRVAAAGDRALGRRKRRAAEDRQRLALMLGKGMMGSRPSAPAHDRPIQETDDGNHL